MVDDEHRSKGSTHYQSTLLEASTKFRQNPHIPKSKLESPHYSVSGNLHTNLVTGKNFLANSFQSNKNRSQASLSVSLGDI